MVNIKLIRRIIPLVLMLAAISLTSCVASAPPQSSLLTASPPPPSASPAPSESATTPAAPATEPTASPAPNRGFPMSIGEFQESFNDYILMPWIPKEVLAFLEDWSLIPGIEASEIMLNIVSVENGSVEVNEVLWVSDDNEPNGFRVDDPSPEIKTYELAEGAGIWILTGMNGYCRISAAELESFAQSDSREYTLWGCTVRDGKIELLVEQYIP